MKILIRLPNWLGDIIMSTAFINAVIESYPDSQIDVIIKKELKGVLDYCEGIHHIYEFSKNDFSGLVGAYRFGKKVSQREMYDFFFCLPNSFSSAWMGFFTKSKKRIGYQNELRSFLLTHAIPIQKNLHRVEDYTYLLSKVTSAIPTSFAVSLQAQTNNNALLPKGKNLLLNIHSEAQSRRMPLELATKILTAIQENHHFNIILTGSKKDIPHAAQLENNFESADFIYNFTGKTSLNELFEMVSRLDYIITTDSGMAHIGNAFNIPSIVLFGAGNENNTRPYNAKDLKIIRKAGLDCAPCISNTCQFGVPKCLVELEVMEILLALDTFIKEKKR